MTGQHRWALGLATGMGLMGMAATGGLMLLANRFVEELSRPHDLPEEGMELSWKMPETQAEPPSQQQRAILFRTSDGALLRGDFWAQPHEAPTIIICHGYRISRALLRPIAKLEYAYGYNTLLFDFRGHGGSESISTSGGNAEVKDLEAAIAAAAQQPETISGNIVIHGFSMGAAVALLSLPHAEVAAVIADSPYAHLDTILRSLIHWRLSEESISWLLPFKPLRLVFSPLAWTTVWASTLVFRLRFRHRLIARPANKFKHWHHQASKARYDAIPPILLIHGTADRFVPIRHAHQIATQAETHSIPVETYYVEDSHHCCAYGDDPQEYVARLQEFLARHLGHTFPKQQAQVDL